MHTGKQKQMNASYQASLVNRHIRRFTGCSFSVQVLISAYPLQMNHQKQRMVLYAHVSTV